MKTPKILVVGSLNMDLTLYGATKVPDFGELEKCENYAYAPGGKGANQAAALAKLGSEAILTGCIGNDRNGTLLLNALHEYHVNTENVQISEEAQTGLVVICTEDRGNSRLYGVLGANMTLTAEKIPEILDREKPDMVLMQLEMPIQTAIDTYRIAKEKGIPTFLDAGPAMKVPLEQFRGIAIISPNEAETYAMTDIHVTDEATARKAAEYIYERAEPERVILKLGEKGSYVYNGTGGKMYPAIKVNAIDSTAAGDTFNAALCTRMCMGDSFEQSIQFASAAAAITVSRKGALQAIPTEQEVVDFCRGR